MYSSNKPKKQLMKKFVYILLAVVIGVIFTSFLEHGVTAYTDSISNLVGQVTHQAAVIETELPPPVPSIVEGPTAVYPEPIKEITLNFVGDIMLDRSVKNSVEKNFDGDYSALFENMSDLAKADILFGNLEGPVSVGG